MAGPLPDDSSVLAALGVGSPGVPPLPPGLPGSGMDPNGTPSNQPAQSIPVSKVNPSGLDLSQIIGNQQASLVNAQTQMASDFSQINTISNAVTKATQASGADDIATTSQQASGLLAAQSAARGVASSYGGNPDDVSFIMNKLGAQWMDTESQRLAAEKVVQQKQSVSFMDDPLTWLSNKMSINTDINNYNNLEEQSNEIYDQLNKINDLNTSTAQSMRAIAKTQTAATVAATTDAAAQKANIANANAQLQGILYNVKGIDAVTQMGQDQVDNSVKGAQTAIAAGHLAVAQQQLTIMSQEQTEKAGLYAQEIKDKQAADASDQLVADTTNRGRAAMGLQPLPAAKIFTMFKLGGEAGDALKSQYSVGATSDAVGKPIIAPSAGTAARVLAMNASPISVVNPAVKPVTDLLQSSYNTARNPSNAQMMGINPRDVSTVDSAVSGLVNNSLLQMGANIKAGDSSNIYQAPPLTSLASLASVKSNPLYNSVLAPQVKAGMSETDPVKIMELTVSAIDQGQISLKDAVNGYSSLFTSAVAVNNATKDFTRFGIAPQSGYTTEVNHLGVFGGSVKVDLTNKAQVSTMFMKYMSSSAGLDQSQGYSPEGTVMDALTGASKIYTPTGAK